MLGVDLWTTLVILLYSLAVTLVTDWLAVRISRPENQNDGQRTTASLGNILGRRHQGAAESCQKAADHEHPGEHPADVDADTV